MDDTHDSRETDPRRSERQSGWRSPDIVRAALLVAGVYVTLQLLWFASSLIFVAFLGLLFGLALSAGVEALHRYGAPRAIAASLLVLLFIGSLTVIGMLLAPTLSRQVDELRDELPAAVDRLEQWLATQRGGVIDIVLPDQEAADTTDARVAAEPRTAGDQEDEPPAISLSERITAEFGNLTQYLFPFLSSTLAILGGVLAILFIAIYFAVQPQLYRRGVLHLLPHRSRAKADLVLGKMALMLRRWLLTQLVAMIAVGLITTATLMLLDVPSAIALGVIAGLLEFVPIIGPIIASIPAIAMAFLNSPQTALLVAGAFVAIQQIESQILTPLLMKEGVDLPPILTLVVQSLMAAVFGFIGLVVAVPLLAAVMVPIKVLYVEDVVGDEMTLPGDRDRE